MVSFKVPPPVSIKDKDEIARSRVLNVPFEKPVEIKKNSFKAKRLIGSQEVRASDDALSDSNNRKQKVIDSRNKVRDEKLNKLDLTNLNIEDLLEFNEIGISAQELREVLPNGIMPNLPNDGSEQPVTKPGHYPKRKYTNNAAKRLYELNFDPLDKMVKLHAKLRKAIHHLTHDELGQPRTRTDKFGNVVPAYSTMAYTALVALEQKLLNDLMPYGYAKVPATLIVEDKPHIPNCIVLTGEKYGRTFEHDTVPLGDLDANNYTNE